MSRGGTPARAKRLSRYASADGLEKNCAQLLILGPAGRRTLNRDDPDVTKVVGTMTHKPVTATNSFLGLSADAFPALAFLHTQYVLQDMPESRGVELSMRDLLTAVGRTACADDDDRPQVVELLDELLTGSFFGMLSTHNGELVRDTLKGIESYTTSESGVCEVVLPEFVVENLQHDFTAYLDHDTLLELKRANPEAMRLWIYAEAQNLKTSVFANGGLPCCIFPTRYTGKNRTLTIDVMLSLPNGSQKEALKLVHAAVDQVNATDPKYEIRVEMGKSWVLVLKRGDLEKPQSQTAGASAPSTKPSTKPSIKRSTVVSTTLSTNPSPNLSPNTSPSTSPTTSPDTSTGIPTEPSIAVSTKDQSTASSSVVSPESSSPLTTTSVSGSRGCSEAAVDDERCDLAEAVPASAPRWSDGRRNQQRPMTTTRRCVDTRDSDFTTVGDAVRCALDAMEKGTWIGDQSSRDPARCIDESPLREDPG